MKGTIISLNDFYLKNRADNESRQRFVNRMRDKGTITCTERSALRHISNNTSYVFTSGKTHIHLTELRG